MPASIPAAMLEALGLDRRQAVKPVVVLLPASDMSFEFERGGILMPLYEALLGDLREIADRYLIWC